jgi:tRNA threonylcarbamoyladenosine biosynthesis protein TsaE
MFFMETLKIEDESGLIDVVNHAYELLQNARVENGASVLALSGTLGAGKTTFIQMLARKLGITEMVNSPTYVIMKKYECDQILSPFSYLYHLDAYRIEALGEMRVLGFEKILGEHNALVCIEWGERIKELLPEQTVYMHLEPGSSETARTITFS